MIKKLKNQKGFTLAEVIVAVFILTVGIIGVIQLFPTGLQATRASKHETTAINLAQGKIEQIKSLPYDNITTESRTPYSTDPNNPYQSYDIQTNVEYVDSSLNVIATDEDLKKISVTIFWIENSVEKKVDVIYVKRQI